MVSIQEKLDNLLRDVRKALDKLQYTLVEDATTAPPEYDANFAYIAGQVAVMQNVGEEVQYLINDINLSKESPTHNGSDWR